MFGSPGIFLAFKPRTQKYRLLPPLFLGLEECLKRFQVVLHNIYVLVGQAKDFTMAQNTSRQLNNGAFGRRLDDCPIEIMISSNLLDGRCNDDKQDIRSTRTFQNLAHVRILDRIRHLVAFKFSFQNAVKVTFFLLTEKYRLIAVVGQDAELYVIRAWLFQQEQRECDTEIDMRYADNADRISFSSLLVHAAVVFVKLECSIKIALLISFQTTAAPWHLENFIWNLVHFAPASDRLFQESFDALLNKLLMLFLHGFQITRGRIWRQEQFVLMKFITPANLDAPLCLKEALIDLISLQICLRHPSDNSRRHGCGTQNDIPAIHPCKMDEAGDGKKVASREIVNLIDDEVG